MEQQNLNDLMKQAQQMQVKLQEAQKKIESLLVVGEAGGGMVKIRMDGRHYVPEDGDGVFVDESLKVPSSKPEGEKPSGGSKWANLDSSGGMLEDLIAAAINDAARKIEKASRDQMAQLASDLNLPSGDSSAAIE